MSQSSKANSLSSIVLNIFKRLFPDQIKQGIKEHLGVPSLHWSLQNLKKTGFSPQIIIDGGAYEGYWTWEVMKIFPAAKILMIEAQESKEQFLATLCRKNKNLNYSINLLSATDDKELFFEESETASQVVENTQVTGKMQKLKSKTLDSLLIETGFSHPDFLKLDLQGYEMEVLRGAEIALQTVEVCLLEISLLDIGGKQPLLAEMVNFMDKQGFQAYDISQFMRRPYDKALLQIDMIFVRKNSFIISQKRWA